jgi:hypothetical protein
MTQTQSNYLEMMKEVHQFTTSQESLIGAEPAFVSGVNTLGQLITAIECLSCHCSLRAGDAAEDKRLKNTSLLRMTASTVSAALEYAAYVQDEALEKDLSFTSADLKKSEPKELLNTATRFFERVEPLAPGLAVYGLTAGVLRAWDLIIKTNIVVSKSPRAAMLHREKLMLCFNQLFKDGLRLCEDFLDPLAISLQQEEPEFHLHYFQKRKIKELAISGCRLSGLVQIPDDSRTQSFPLGNATVTLVETGVIVKSDAAGNFSFRIPKKGRYTVRAEKDGFYTKTSKPVDLKEGETGSVTLLLNPAEILQD